MDRLHHGYTFVYADLCDKPSFLSVGSCTLEGEARMERKHGNLCRLFRGSRPNIAISRVLDHVRDYVLCFPEGLAERPDKRAVFR